MLSPDEGEIEDFVTTLHFLSENNKRVTKKVTRNYLYIIRHKLTHGKTEEQIEEELENLVNFITIPDEIKDNRIEWILGFPQVVARVA